MGGNSESEEFEDDDVEEVPEDEDLDLDRVIRDLDMTKRRTPRVGEPAWRQLERRLEQKQTAELISDFDDYDVGESDDAGSTPRHRMPRQH
jgi:hypothetical protein